MTDVILSITIIVLLVFLLIAFLAIHIQSKIITTKNNQIASLKEENNKRSERVKNWYKFTNNLG